MSIKPILFRYKTVSFRIQLDITSAEGEIFSGLVEYVVVPGQMGEMAIYPHHAPLITRLRPGLIRLARKQGEERSYFASTGILEVQPHIVTVLADTVLRSRDLDEQAARSARDRAERAMQERALSEEDYKHLKAELELENALLRAIDQLRRRQR